MGDVDAARLLEALDQQMIDGAEARHAVVELAGIGARVGDELRQRARRHLRIGEQHQRHVGELGDRRQRRQRIERHLHQELVDDEVVGRGDQDRVAVGLGARDFLGADVAGRAGLGLDHELLAEPLLHADREQPHDRSRRRRRPCRE